MNFNTKKVQEIGKAIAQELKRCGFTGQDSLYEVENGARELLRQIGQESLEGFLEDAEEELHEKFKESDLKKDYRNHSRRKAVILSTFGKLEFKRRYYYQKKEKEGEEKGFANLDRQMKFSAGRVTPSLAELLALEGISTPFEEASKKIEKFLLFSISDNTVRSETEEFGLIQEKIEKELIVKSQDPAWRRKRRREEKKVRKGRIYGSTDGFMVPLKEGWKEFKALAWYNVEEISTYTKKRHHSSSVGEQNNLQAKNITYHCDKQKPQEFGKLFWATGCQRQVDFYEERVFIGDGAKWIWDMIEFYYPDATQILDWYHATQYLYNIADAAFEKDSEEYDA